MAEATAKQLGKVRAHTRKRVFPLQLTIPVGIALFAFGIWMLVWGPSVRKQARAKVVQQQQLNGVQNNKEEEGERTAVLFMQICGGVMVAMGLAFGIGGSLLNPWELQIREQGAIYKCGSKKHVIPWDKITDLRVYVNKRPMLYYHIQSRTMKKKVIFWLFEGHDDDMIRLLDKNVPSITYWKNLRQQVGG